MFPNIQELSYEGVSEFCLLFRIRVLSQINSFIHKCWSKTYLQFKYFAPGTFIYIYLYFLKYQSFHKKKKTKTKATKNQTKTQTSKKKQEKKKANPGKPPKKPPQKSHLIIELKNLTEIRTSNIQVTFSSPKLLLLNYCFTL